VRDLPPPPGDGLFDARLVVEDRCAVVAVRGDVDVYTAAPFRRALEEARLSGRPLIVVDLAGVGFMDSTGFGQLVSLVSGQGAPTVVVANCRPIVRNALRLMGLDSLLTLHDYGESPQWPGVTDTSR
jgi:anti-sigma B factor antagonist